MPGNLLFQPDYQADPVWDAATGCMVCLESLPIEADTRSAIRAWAARWEQVAQKELAGQEMDAEHESGILPGPAEPGFEQTWQMIEQEGRALCQQLRHELGEGWRVGWVTFEHGQRHVQWQPDGPVTLFLRGRASGLAFSPTHPRPSRPGPTTARALGHEDGATAARVALSK